MMNIQRLDCISGEGNKWDVAYQARSPRATVNPLVIPAVIRPENAPEIREPEYINAVLKPNSFRVYHDERKKSTPGK
jgi:hypothetical protein